MRRIGPMLVLAACAKGEAPEAAPVAEPRCLGVEIADADWGAEVATATSDGGLVAAVVKGFRHATIVALDPRGAERWRVRLQSADRQHWRPRGVFERPDGTILVVADDNDSERDRYPDEIELVLLSADGAVLSRRRAPGHGWQDVVALPGGKLLAAIWEDEERVAVVSLDPTTLETQRWGDVPAIADTEYRVVLPMGATPSSGGPGPAIAWVERGSVTDELRLVYFVGGADAHGLLAHERSRLVALAKSSGGFAALVTSPTRDVLLSSLSPSTRTAPVSLPTPPQRYADLVGPWLLTWTPAPEGSVWNPSADPPWSGSAGTVGLKTDGRELTAYSGRVGRVALAPTGGEIWLVFSAYDAAGQLHTRAIRTDGAADLRPCAQLDEGASG